MKSREFCYWLQGYFEITNANTTLNVRQVEIIKNHLDIVFAHEIDPSYPNQEKLNNLHGNSQNESKPRC